MTNDASTPTGAGADPAASTSPADSGGAPPDNPEAAAAFLAAAHGDRGVAKHFRNSLETLRDQTSDPGFQALVDDILSGRKPPRALAGSQAFDRVVAPKLAQATAFLAALSPEERARLEEQGRQELAALGAEPDAPPT